MEGGRGDDHHESVPRLLPVWEVVPLCGRVGPVGEYDPLSGLPEGTNGVLVQMSWLCKIGFHKLHDQLIWVDRRSGKPTMGRTCMGCGKDRRYRW
jgi:hypothetical protein